MKIIVSQDRESATTKFDNLRIKDNSIFINGNEVANYKSKEMLRGVLDALTTWISEDSRCEIFYDETMTEIGQMILDRLSISATLSARRIFQRKFIIPEEELLIETINYIKTENDKKKQKQLIKEVMQNSFMQTTDIKGIVRNAIKEIEEEIEFDSIWLDSGEDL